MSNTVSGGTGPHYYQELVACPHQFDRIFLMNVRALVSVDGGKTFNEMNEIWDAWVVQGQTPCRACVESKLAVPQFTVEISVIAAL